jgi:hypothetical protein
MVGNLGRRALDPKRFAKPDGQAIGWFAGLRKGFSRNNGADPNIDPLKVFKGNGRGRHAD